MFLHFTTLVSESGNEQYFCEVQIDISIVYFKRVIWIDFFFHILFSCLVICQEIYLNTLLLFFGGIVGHSDNFADSQCDYLYQQSKFS